MFEHFWKQFKHSEKVRAGGGGGEENGTLILGRGSSELAWPPAAAKALAIPVALPLGDLMSYNSHRGLDQWPCGWLRLMELYGSLWTAGGRPVETHCARWTGGEQCVLPPEGLVQVT